RPQGGAGLLTVLQHCNSKAKLLLSEVTTKILRECRTRFRIGTRVHKESRRRVKARAQCTASGRDEELLTGSHNLPVSTRFLEVKPASRWYFPASKVLRSRSR